MDKRVLEAIRLMERRMGDELAIEEIAGVFDLTLHHFHRLFVEEIGEPPASFLRRIRMDAAALRLKWADEPTETMAHALGFRSRSAFIRAFERQFGVPPARYRKEHRAASEMGGSLEGHMVALREVESFHLLAKRYVGDIFRMAEYWTDFFASLPEDITRQGKALYIGQLHDDFRLTDPDKVRYDCAITVDPSHRDSDGLLAAHRLELIATEAGRYVTIDHRGHYLDIPSTYDLVCQGWIIPKGLVPGSNPAIEIHTVPRHMQDSQNVQFTILFPVE